MSILLSYAMCMSLADCCHDMSSVISLSLECIVMKQLKVGLCIFHLEVAKCCNC